MRSTLILVSLAATFLAAPVPSDNVSQLARRVSDDNAAPIDATVEKRSGVKFNDRSVDEEHTAVEKPRSPLYRPNRRSIEEGEAEVEKRSGVKFNDRSEDAETEAEEEKRYVRVTNPHPREKRRNRVGIPRSESEEEKLHVRIPHPRSEDSEAVEKRVNHIGVPRPESEEVEKRKGRMRVGRSAEAEEVEKRKGRMRVGRSIEAEAEVEKRVNRN